MARMSETTPEDFDKLPRFDAVPEADVERWLAMTRDEREQYAIESGIGPRLESFVDEHGRTQVWYPTTSLADYDVVEKVDGVLGTVGGLIVAAVESEEAARP